MEKATYIVIDESGAMHQKYNNYFIIAGFITHQIYSIKSAHKKVEKRMREQYASLSKYSELKAVYLKAKYKIEILNEVLSTPTTIPLAIIIDKKHTVRRKKHNENIKYNYFLQILLKYILINYPNLVNTERIELLLDNRNVSVGSLNSLEDYLNAELGLEFDKEFKVHYRDSKTHREVQIADLISNALFGYYNYRANDKTYTKIKAFKKIVISKFPYKEFKEPSATIKMVENVDTVINK